MKRLKIRKVLLLISCVAVIVCIGGCSNNSAGETATQSSDITQINKTTETNTSLSIISENDTPSVTDENDVFSLDALKSSKYYDLLLEWFEENNISEEERENLLNDEEFRKDAMRDSFWAKH